MGLISVGLPSMLDAHSDVFALSAPPKILRPVIGRIVVEMKANHPVWPWPMKGFGYSVVHPNPACIIVARS